ncbi:MAG: histidine phosphatase family protein [Pirellulaceae bacterium]|jgi:2,3-bisphosphoglycerate-dependent phosphoglycerate mutase|nr:histidine phosphatase family protein [Pirellulaceae bacterium]MDP6555949.1 histidine phosphatase family protein [Pirellulaceae bacterium]
MELYLIRHAQSQNNALPEEQRVEDPGLTELGNQQADCLGKWIPALRLTKVITSPFLRALETARRIQEATNLTPEVRTAIHEMGGCCSGYPEVGMVGRPGLNRAEIEVLFPAFQIAAEINGGGWWRCQPYETRALAKRRAADVLQQTREEFAHTSQRVAYVTHADFKQLFLEHFHTEPLDVACNTSVTKVLITAEECRLADHNGVQHLPEHLIAR